MEITVREVKSTPIKQEEVAYRNPVKKHEEKVYEVEKKELSKNIQRFEKQVKVYKENPYSFNQVAKKSAERNVSPTQTASQMIANKTYNTIGKVLGVDTIHEWNKYYDKVYVISEWAKKNIGDDLDKMIAWITKKSNSIPSLGARRIDDLYIHASMKMKL